ncbi:Uncharacterized protein TCAP_05973, partial [Tolypocladium capitatum]
PFIVARVPRVASPPAVPLSVCVSSLRASTTVIAPPTHDARHTARTMSALRPLRGGCQCGRNRYIIAVPQDGVGEAQVLFNTEPVHLDLQRQADRLVGETEIPLATPLAAYIRVPLAWYHSTTFAFFPDETHSMIRRVYTHPSQRHSKRHFCGFCGTPLSYWSEHPMTEADYINLTLGSLLREDLRDLEDMGLIPDESEQEHQHQQKQQQQGQGEERPVVSTPPKSTVLRESFGVPWFDGMVEGTRLGNMRRSQGVQWPHDGSVRMEWEIVEYTDGGESGHASDDVGMETETASASGKRKLQDRDD